jgi:hypothetical protein
MPGCGTWSESSSPGDVRETVENVGVIMLLSETDAGDQHSVAA